MGSNPSIVNYSENESWRQRIWMLNLEPLLNEESEAF